MTGPMRLFSFEIKRRAVVAIVGAAGATVAWYFWAGTRIPSAPEPVPEARPIVRVTGSSAGDLLREQAEYLDPTPLFFPTPHNFGFQREVRARRREPGEGFSNFPARLAFDEQRIVSYALEAESVPRGPKDVLALGDEAPFAGFGEAELPLPPLPVRGGHIEVKSLSDGGLALVAGLSPGALPKVEFSPLEFLVLVGLNGIVGEPLLTRNSGSEQVDAFVRDYLVKSFRLGERLAPGKYAVSVGP